MMTASVSHRRSISPLSQERGRQAAALFAVVKSSFQQLNTRRNTNGFGHCVTGRRLNGHLAESDLEVPVLRHMESDHRRTGSRQAQVRQMRKADASRPPGKAGR